MGLFDDIENVNTSTARVYFQEGVYEYTVSKFFHKKSQRNNDDLVIIEGKITNVLTKFGNSNLPNQTVSQVINLKHGDLALRDVKGFVAAAAGLSAEEVTAEVCQKAVSGDGSNFKGTVVVATAQSTTTKSGKPFTKVTWQAA